MEEKFNDTLQSWDLDYEERKSLTNEDSFILNIKKIKKKFHENYFDHKSKGNGKTTTVINLASASQQGKNFSY